MPRSDFGYSEETQKLRRVFDHMLDQTLLRVERDERVTGEEVIDMLEAHRRIDAIEQVEYLNAMTRGSVLTARLGDAGDLGFEETPYKGEE